MLAIIFVNVESIVFPMEQNQKSRFVEIVAYMYKKQPVSTYDNRQAAGKKTIEDADY